MMDCLDEHQIQAFHQGRMSPERLRATSRHLDACRDCRLRSEEMLRQQDELIHELRLAVPALESLSPGPRHPQQIGRYDILECIGQGGMGTVYLAQQSTPLRRRVALKIIKPGMDSASVISRFEAERQTLALMDHPHVAKVFDAGTTSNGLPYFVMEYVEGVSLTAFVAQRTTSLTDRLELFISVCEAVQHAHQKGIIHRDIKPSNILIQQDAGGPIPKVIDFGVARATDQTLADATELTAAGQLVGTPAYMSPEQADPLGQDIDTRSDIYSLGVVLYELLTDDLPFDRELLKRASYDEMRRLICTVDPPRPSARVRQSSTTGTTSTSIGGLTRRDVSRRLNHDLDWITMRALNKDRSQRYPTASDLAQDIRRHLHHEPVEAGPPSATYRIRKVMRRHRGTVAATTFLFLSLAAGLLGTTVQWARAERARTTAEMVNAFLQDMFKSVDPHIAQGRDVTVLRAMLDQAADEVNSKLSNEPAVAGDLHNTLSISYRMLSLYDEAVDHALQALDYLAETHGTDSVDYAWTTWHLGVMYSELSRLDKAESLVESAKQIFLADLGSTSLEYLEAIGSLGYIHKVQGKLDDAEQEYRHILRDIPRDDPEYTELLTSTLGNLGKLLEQRGAYGEAQTLLEDALAIRRASLPATHGDVAVSMVNLGSLYMSMGDTERALALQEEALEIRRAIYAPDHVRLGISMHSLASTLFNAGRYEDAQRYNLEALGIYRRALPENHRYTASLLNNIGMILNRQQRYDEALAYHEQALAMRRALFDAHHPDVATSLNNLAGTLSDLGRVDEAEPHYLEALAIRQEAYPQGHWLSGLTEQGLARLYLFRGQAEQALHHQQHVLDIWTLHFPAGHPRLVEAQRQLAEIHIAVGDLERADAILEDIAPYMHADEDTPQEQARMLFLRGQLLAARQDYAQAEPLLLQAHQIVQSRRDATSVLDYRRIRRGVLEFYELWERPDLAEAFEDDEADR